MFVCLCDISHVGSMFSSDVFKLDPDFLENEEKYKTIKRGKNETTPRPPVSVQSDRLLHSLTNRV